MAHFLAGPAELRPTAVLAANDLTATGIVAAARHAEPGVPGDLSVVGSDDIGASRYPDPPLTSIRLPMRDLGSKAVELLREETRRPPDEARTPTRLLLPVNLVVRGSTGPPAP